MIERIIIATHNKGKLQEFGHLLRPYAAEIVSAGDLGLPEPVEDGTTFRGNALIKAKAASLATNALALADDSGLCVNALNGAPGIYSARWAKPTIVDGINRVQKELGDNPDRSAFFICVLALYWPDGTFKTFEGRVDGVLTRSPRGTNGHGYDPIFQPTGYTRSFGEISDDEKNAISHRGIATRLLLQEYFAKLA